MQYYKRCLRYLGSCTKAANTLKKGQTVFIEGNNTTDERQYGKIRKTSAANYKSLCCAESHEYLGKDLVEGRIQKEAKQIQ